MESEMTKLCKDCKHYRCNWKTLWEPCCARKVVTSTSVITGETTTKTKLERCTTQRLIEKGITHFIPYIKDCPPLILCNPLDFDKLTKNK